MDLTQRRIGVEPVECLTDRHRVDVAVVERDSLRRAAKRRNAGHSPLELGAHLAHRLDREDVRAAWHEQARELARSGGKVEHCLPRAQLEPLDDLLDRGNGIVRPPALVHSGGSEAAGGGMELRHGSRDRGR